MTPRKGAKVKRVNYAADFETTTTHEDCRVWAWGIASIDDPEGMEWGKTVEEFVWRASEHNSTIYFHNLKFDAHFIIDFLLNNGYEHAASSRYMERFQFTTLISDMGKFFSMTVKWANGHTTEFRDSHKKMPMPLSRVATSFNVGIVKGDLDYHAHRPLGYTPTPAELDYLRRDVVILAKAMSQVLEAGMTKLTVASDAMAEYKSLTTSKLFARLFPVLSDDMDAEIRRALRGGFTYADPRFKGVKTGSGLVLDVNSLYPFVMANMMLPYDEPQFMEGEVETDERWPLAIFSITFTAKLKPNHIPCIQIKGSSMFTATEYLSEVAEPTTLMVTNVDLALYQDHYDVKILEYGGGWRFHAAQGMFKTYIDKWSKIKEEAKGGKREIAKLHLNALFGKFGANPNVTSKYPVLKDGVVKYVRGEDETRAPVYTAMAVFITSYARNLTIRAAQENYDTFAYADTDSLHLLQDNVPDSIDIHPTRMGAWKLEYHFQAALYIRAKLYLEQHHDDCVCSDGQGVPFERCKGGYQNAIAGVPVDISAKLTFDDVLDGAIIHGKKSPKSVPGGLILVDVPFMVKH